jgi:hypothetical protein
MRVVLVDTLRGQAVQCTAFTLEFGDKRSSLKAGEYRCGHSQEKAPDNEETSWAIEDRAVVGCHHAFFGSYGPDIFTVLEKQPPGRKHASGRPRDWIISPA